MNMPNLLAVPGGTIDPAHLLGVQVLYTIPDKAVSYDKLRAAWTLEGLDESLIPDKRSSVNTAEYACRSVETRKGGSASNGRGRLIVKVDRVSTSARQCVYQLTRQVFDEANQAIEHEKGMTLTFDADALAVGNDPWTVRPWEEEHYLAMRPLEVAIREHFNEHVGTVPGQKVRNAVRDYLTRKDKLGGTNMRRASGGVYFVPIEHASTLDSIETVVKGLYGDDADFDMIPMANSVGIKEIVEKHHVLNVREEAAQLVATVAERLRNEDTKPRRDFVENIMRQRRELGQHRAKMQELLGRETEAVNEALSLIDEQIGKLWDA